MSSVTRRIAAPPGVVYGALVDAESVAAWRVPDGMRSEVHEFEPRPGGRFRISLTYDDPGTGGKSTGATDTYAGYFAEPEADRRVVEVLAFETDRAEMRGEMTVVTELAAEGNGTRVTMTFTGLPAGVAVRENEIGTAMALDRLAGLAESRPT